MSEEQKPLWTEGPWSTEAFNEMFAGEPNYGAMILGGDGETIVAQCVAERDLPLLLIAPDLFKGLQYAVALIESAERETNWTSTAWHEETAAVELRALLARATEPLP